MRRNVRWITYTRCKSNSESAGQRQNRPVAGFDRWKIRPIQLEVSGYVIRPTGRATPGFGSIYGRLTVANAIYGPFASRS